MDDSNLLTKQELRRNMRHRLKGISPSTMQYVTDAIFGSLRERADLFGPGKTVGLFGGLPGEPDLSTLLPWLHSVGSRGAFFAVVGTDLTPFTVQKPSQLVRGPFGIWEPLQAADRALAPAEIDIVLVPGLAFGKRDGSRLGRGAGFYDRFFAQPAVRAERIGVAHAFQVLDHVPTEVHDAKMHALVTEQGRFQW